ncbi:MAG TPA: protein kinase [Planctomycetaceae bacterium]|nr:protein kinase [Planctomycetaceae bacterium]
MSIVDYFCTSCNVRTLPESDERNCPRCGSGLSPLDECSLYETVMVTRADSQEDTHSDVEPSIPEVIGVFRRESFLGAGAMGRVYLVRHEILHRKSALKILSPRVVHQHEDYVARFHNEGRTAAALVHPNIVTTHAIGEEGGFHFLEMEFVAGETLQQLIDREGRLTPIRATSLAAQIAEGLAQAHRQEIVHSDLKADNILLTPLGVPKIVDFGLAKQLIVQNNLTSRKLVGTPVYMAPELFSGTPPNKQSDVYALGVCYFKMLTGRLPFLGENLSQLQAAILNDPLPSFRQLGLNLGLEMVECASLLLSKAPANRPQSAIEAAQYLRAILSEARDVESLLLEAFGRTDQVSWTRTGLNYSLIVRLPDGRTQKVFVEPSEHRGSEKLLAIYSICCEVQSAYYEHALKLNAEIAHGAFAVRNIDGRPHFVMVDTYPRATVDPDEIRRSVLEVATRADGMEHLLTGEDVH